MSNQNESLDVNAKTVEEAIERGLAQLGLSQEQVEIEVVKEGKRGVFGLGAEDAQIRLTPKQPVTENIQTPENISIQGEVSTEEVEAGPESETDITEEVSIEDVNEILATGAEQDSVETEEAPETVSSDESSISDKAQTFAKHYLEGLLEHMGIKADVSISVAPDLVESDEEPPLVLDVTGKDLGILIGRRSETLHALQYMVRLMVSKELRSWQPVIVDVESYRVRRRRSLHQIAEKMAERAVTSQKPVVLESMPAYERRIIHIYLKDHPDVFTKSVGSDESRKVTIIPK